MNPSNDHLVQLNARSGSGKECPEPDRIPSSNARILFFDLPFQNFRGGTLGISILKAILQRAGVGVDARYLNLEFAKIVGVEFYGLMCAMEGGQYRGGIFFSPHYYGRPIEPFVKEVLPQYFAGIQLSRLDAGGARTAWTEEMFLRKCEQVCTVDVPRFLEQTTATIPWHEYDIVCFSMMFDQVLAAACIARWIKQNHPDKHIVFGGANCHDEMGLEIVKAFPCVDVAALGEGDRTIVPLVRALREQTPLEEIQGIAFRRNGQVVRTKPAPVIENLDELPIPDHTAYFAAMRDSRLTTPQLSPLAQGHEFVYFEMSRGCWWGEKHLCTFCGLNADGLSFRHKSAERCLQELESIFERDGCNVFTAADNIVDMSFFKTFLPVLAQRNQNHPPESQLKLFCELKSNLKKPQIELLKRAGVFGVQPGIESFSDRVLELMDKGATGIQQIQFIKWATEIRLRVLYGLLYGTPGERAEDYDQMRLQVPYIAHLAPPTYMTPVSLDRFSPYFKTPERYGIRNIRPLDSYARLYTDENIDLSRLAYKFTFDHDDHHDEKLNEAVRRWQDAVQKWMKGFRPGTLLYARTEDGVLVLDRRGLQPKLTVLRDAQAEIFLYCDEQHSLQAIQRQFSHYGEQNVAGFIQRLAARHWLYKDSREHCISLPLECDKSSIVDSNLNIRPLKEVGRGRFLSMYEDDGALTPA